MKIIRVHEFGGPEKLVCEEASPPTPRENEILVRNAFIGVNFADVGMRNGSSSKTAITLYARPLPLTPGNEASGTVEALGPDVTGFVPGDKVAYRGVFEAYAEFVTVPVEKLLKVPTGVPMDVAGGCLTQGMTAHYVTHDAHLVRPGEWVLIHAAAGGTGSLVVQMAKLRGATVVATASTPEKVARAYENGADHVFNYSEADFEELSRSIPGFDGFHAVLDCVGVATFEKGLRLLRPRGNMVIFGMSSGPIPPFDLQRLNPLGSLSIRRTNLNDYIPTRHDLEVRAATVFDWIREGKITVRIGGRFPLADARLAHAELEERHSLGKLLLVP